LPGFSFTRNDAGYARNETDVGRDLYAAIVQFFMLFPELKSNDFYVSGESYAGKYVPALTYTIHKKNPTAELKINLKGMAIGDGLCDPVTMTDYGDFLYNIGLIDEINLQYFKQQSELAISLINKQQWHKAFESITPQDMGYWPKFINKPAVRKSIHVGNLTFNDGSVVENYLEEDVMKSVKPWIEELLDNYKVLIYNGQLDVIIAYTLTENFLNSLNWKYAAQYQQSPRYIWQVDHQVAGYVREVPGFVQVMIRNAGHMVPYDQPKWAFDMISRFTAEKSFPTQ
ncbi:probable serine carboxypeptidase CPVL, partial [Panulirus ornatus]|uniref:probable serine carboxypeptidase CPVL n=1 Tax=Panulirus ornatus TaxID=150431 RepID=UPI003A8437AD